MGNSNNKHINSKNKVDFIIKQSSGYSFTIIYSFTIKNILKLVTHCTINYFNYVRNYLFIFYITSMMLEKNQKRIKWLRVFYIKAKKYTK